MPEPLWGWALHHHPILHGLATDELKELRRIATLFAHEKEFEGAEGIETRDEVKVCIAVQAALPVLKLGIDWYSNWTTVVVVPTHFEEKRVSQDRAGVVHEWTETDAGQSWRKGPVVLSWSDVEASGWRDGFNVVLREYPELYRLFATFYRQDPAARLDNRPAARRRYVGG